MRLLTAMKGINDRIERHNRPRESDDSERPVSSPQDGTQGKGRSKTGITEVDALMRKLDILESGEKHLHKEMEVIQREMGELSRKVKKSAVSLVLCCGAVFGSCRLLVQKVTEIVTDGCVGGHRTVIDPYWETYTTMSSNYALHPHLVQIPK